MRVKFGNEIKLAKCVARSEISNFFFVKTFFHEECYSVKVNKSQEEMDEMWNSFLQTGYIDFSDCEYAN